ncbi:glutamyl-tRNA(Gln) amidotransferase, A subunit [Exiguobacterium sibiricum 255-15]|uniref:Glutamyl-tRNA(Gln) amidotransferase subunit A n=1 Tax=Exiguobacterium sibiricum (strain DSM 17290 / CCUG 55495 / CIP 109462 / JCM 13490 / 255-15) TaxID=262543 RepID=GATA_EXIS2|nr:Asp-tRNA(Asn)/Glu-tRNA(Gln) amidotransferase subunit GatA [Exiguobacterium sibiricum]B1YM01.1 RecName: Full=Glutamyl-tRNA(Gln) amidotransferase subunit A; Short=Glu-ADT subunit A [Exiguobacterium sibiricum 255-15]ACB61959.1 glutamyl-tRNA(Gln) amidotransferase, A subunit [Exiguobacterium sibiricum 255-15]
MSLFEHGVKNLHTLVKDGEVKVSELVQESFDRIDRVDGKIGAFLSLNEDAFEQAKRMDEIAKHEANPLFGLPIGVKDNIVTKGMTTTCGSKFLENFVPAHDATVVERLHEAGAITIGKLNMDEFAMGSSNENSAYKPVRNPWNTKHVPGGSSGGSAAAVAAGEVLFSLGSDTGGSIRQPAAYCGVVGLKPTYGLVSRYGLVAFASSLDQIGPLTRTVEDNAYLLSAIAGHCDMDSTSANVNPTDYTQALTGDIKGLKIAVPKEYFGEGISEGVKENIRAAIKKLESLGATVDEVSLPNSKYALATYYLLASSEASSNLARFDGIRYGVRAEADALEDVFKYSRAQGFGDEVKRRIMLGTYALSSGYYDAYYKKAQQARTLIKHDFDQVLANYDVIIGPTAPTPAFELGAQNDDPVTMYANDILTIPINLAGVPAISVPAGLVDGLPVGLQIIGKHFDEATIYRAAHAFELATGGFALPKL